MAKIDEGAIKMFRDDMLSSGQIAKHYQCSRSAVIKYLNKHEVHTGKGQWFIICTQCGCKVFRPRCQIRGKIFSFCNAKCYYAYIHNPDYQEHRNGQRRARAALEALHGFMPYDIVIHHIDSNTDNNALNNLLVFRNQSDHMAFHRFRQVKAFNPVSCQWELVRKSK